MSLLDKFKDQFVDRDDEDMEEEDLGEETAPVNPAQPAASGSCPRYRQKCCPASGRQAIHHGRRQPEELQ